MSVLEWLAWLWIGGALVIGWIGAIDDWRRGYELTGYPFVVVFATVFVGTLGAIFIAINSVIP
jgi:TRAP-type C4-dicarboxylate transport system permease small subunit